MAILIVGARLQRRLNRSPPSPPVQLIDEDAPFMIVGLSTSEDLAIADQLAFAERRVRNFETVKIVTIDQTTPISIGSLPCYTTTAIGDGDETATSLFVAL